MNTKAGMINRSSGFEKLMRRSSIVLITQAAKTTAVPHWNKVVFIQSEV
jgi:hypothetical protein